MCSSTIYLKKYPCCQIKDVPHDYTKFQFMGHVPLEISSNEKHTTLKQSTAPEVNLIDKVCCALDLEYHPEIKTSQDNCNPVNEDLDKKATISEKNIKSATKVFNLFNMITFILLLATSILMPIFLVPSFLIMGYAIFYSVTISTYVISLLLLHNKETIEQEESDKYEKHLKEINCHFNEEGVSNNLLLKGKRANLGVPCYYNNFKLKSINDKILKDKLSKFFIDGEAGFYNFCNLKSLKELHSLDLYYKENINKKRLNSFNRMIDILFAASSLCGVILKFGLIFATLPFVVMFAILVIIYFLLSLKSYFEYKHEKLQFDNELKTIYNNFYQDITQLVKKEVYCNLNYDDILGDIKEPNLDDLLHKIFHNS